MTVQKDDLDGKGRIDPDDNRDNNGVFDDDGSPDET